MSILVTGALNLARDAGIERIVYVSVVVGPESLTGESTARIWSEALQREIRYGGDDLDSFEQQLAAYGPDWLAYDMRLMMAGIQSHGMHPRDGAADAMQNILGRPLRTYRDAVHEMPGSSH